MKVMVNSQLGKSNVKDEIINNDMSEIINNDMIPVEDSEFFLCPILVSLLIISSLSFNLPS